MLEFQQRSESRWSHGSCRELRHLSSRGRGRRAKRGGDGGAATSTKLLLRSGPLTPTLSREGRGSPPSVRQQRRHARNEDHQFVANDVPQGSHGRDSKTELSAFHHRPAPRRSRRLLWQSHRQDAEYRRPGRRRPALREILRRVPDLHAEPHRADDRPHAHRQRLPAQRHSARPGGGDVR